MTAPNLPIFVTFRDREYFTVDAAALARLKQAALDSPNKRARICLHASHVEPVQEMIIALVGGVPIPAHRQRSGRKTYYMIEGSLRVTFLADDGRIEKEYVLSAHGGEPAILTFPATHWHACEATSSISIYAESLPGPFHPENTEWRE